MSGNSSLDTNDEKVPVGNVKSVLSAIDDGFDGKNAVALLAQSAEKRDEAVMCLRLIAGLNPMLRDKAEKTIELLMAVPFPAQDGH